MHGHFETFDRQLLTILQPVPSRDRLPAALDEDSFERACPSRIVRSTTNDPRLPVLRSLRPRTLDKRRSLSVCLTTNNNDQRGAAVWFRAVARVCLRCMLVAVGTGSLCRLPGQVAGTNVLLDRGRHCQHVDCMPEVGHFATPVERRQELSPCRPHVASRPDDPRHAATRPEIRMTACALTMHLLIAPTSGLCRE